MYLYSTVLNPNLVRYINNLTDYDVDFIIDYDPKCAAYNLPYEHISKESNQIKILDRLWSKKILDAIETRMSYFYMDSESRYTKSEWFNKQLNLMKLKYGPVY